MSINIYLYHGCCDPLSYIPFFALSACILRYRCQLPYIGEMNKSELTKYGRKFHTISCSIVWDHYVSTILIEERRAG